MCWENVLVAKCINNQPRKQPIDVLVMWMFLHRTECGELNCILQKNAMNEWICGWMKEMTQGLLPMQHCYSPTQIAIIAPTLRTCMVHIGCPMSIFNVVIQGPNANARGQDLRCSCFRFAWLFGVMGSHMLLLHSNNAFMELWAGDGTIVITYGYCKCHERLHVIRASLVAPLSACKCQFAGDCLGQNLTQTKWQTRAHVWWRAKLWISLAEDASEMCKFARFNRVLVFTIVLAISPFNLATHSCIHVCILWCIDPLVCCMPSSINSISQPLSLHWSRHAIAPLIGLTNSVGRRTRFVVDIDVILGSLLICNAWAPFNKRCLVNDTAWVPGKPCNEDLTCRRGGWKKWMKSWPAWIELKGVNSKTKMPKSVKTIALA